MEGVINAILVALGSLAAMSLLGFGAWGVIRLVKDSSNHRKEDADFNWEMQDEKTKGIMDSMRSANKAYINLKDGDIKEHTLREYNHFVSLVNEFHMDAFGNKSENGEYFYHDHFLGHCSLKVAERIDELMAQENIDIKGMVQFAESGELYDLSNKVKKITRKIYEKSGKMSPYFDSFDSTKIKDLDLDLNLDEMVKTAEKMYNELFGFRGQKSREHYVKYSEDAAEESEEESTQRK